MIGGPSMYVIDTTLGHGGLFNWLINANGTIEVRRRFVGGQVAVNLYRKAKLDQLHAFVAKREWTALANNVEKLHHGTEKEGLGQFLKETLGMDVAAAQGASQLAAIFVRAGAWEGNGRRRGMAFRCLATDWQGLVESYYEQCKHTQSGAKSDCDDPDAAAREEGQQLYFNLGAALEVKDNKADALPPIPLPVSLSRLLSGAHFVKDTIGCSSSAVFKICGLPDVGDAYLKVMELSAGEDLLREKAVLDWLQGQLPVPKILHFTEEAGMQYLLISAIPGLGAENEHFLSPENAPEMVRVLARGLRLIHSLDISGCPFPRDLDVMLAEARRQVEFGLVDTDNLQPENMGRDPEDILQELVAKRPHQEDLVLTHGDYCLPNILLQDGQLSGFIDWGRAGVADRYADIALAVRSLRYNLGDARGEALARLFLEEYGLEHVDEEKIAYFILLDELF